MPIYALTRLTESAISHILWRYYPIEYRLSRNEKYYISLKVQMCIRDRINDKKKELSDLEDEIDQTQDNLEAAKQQSASQYEDCLLYTSRCV